MKKRKWGQAIRLEVEEGMDVRLLKIIQDELHIGGEDIYPINGPLDITFLMKMYDIDGFDHLREHRYKGNWPVPELPEDADMFACIRKEDILMFHPYQTFEPVSAAQSAPQS